MAAPSYDPSPGPAGLCIRTFQPRDREAVRRICCETGLGGRPVDPLFADRELFADFLTRYYTDFEPESSLVVEAGGEVVGYLIGCARHRRHRMIQPAIAAGVAARALLRLLAGRYDRASRSYLRWCAVRAHREIPPGPSGAAHFHFNLLPGFRHRGIGLRLFRAFLEILRARGARRVYIRIEIPEGRRPEGVFRRFGFRQLHRRRLSRYTGGDRPVDVASFARELAQG